MLRYLAGGLLLIALSAVADEPADRAGEHGDRGYYQELLEVAKGGTRQPELSEARDFVTFSYNESRG